MLASKIGGKIVFCGGIGCLMHQHRMMETSPNRKYGGSVPSVSILLLFPFCPHLPSLVDIVTGLFESVTYPSM
jgi:hypothetical protein